MCLHTRKWSAIMSLITVCQYVLLSDIHTKHPEQTNFWHVSRVPGGVWTQDLLHWPEYHWRSGCFMIVQCLHPQKGMNPYFIIVSPFHMYIIVRFICTHYIMTRSGKNHQPPITVKYMLFALIYNYTTRLSGDIAALILPVW